MWCDWLQGQQAPSGAPQEAPSSNKGLETELRRARRREEKLQALLFRLKEDCTSPTAFEALKDVRTLEYELDFANNKAQRERQVGGGLNR